ncbi:tryptophan synthase beta subunit-like PLP-dependent enzyme [Biscogniauxia marginata]|nr:tryptophan synthase beta subunit-like PLP-dependent enzyme [Biscogniauxia marginata]
MTRPLPSETAARQAKAPDAIGAPAPGLQKLYIETPCIPSPALSRVAGCNIFLKLENLQPSGSFKSRGIGTMMYRAMMRAAAADVKDSSSSSPSDVGSPSSSAAGGDGGGGVHFYCSSGGNAGLACATAAATLGRPCTIAVPVTTSPRVVAQLRLLGAAVHQVGADWSSADRFLRRDLLARDDAGVYVPPFDHPDIWDGVSTLVDELCAQVPALTSSSSSSSSSSPPFDAIVCNVGGGGLLNGIMSGVSRHFPSSSPSSPSPSPSESPEPKPSPSPSPPTVLALETAGADSLAASVAAGELVTLPRISSVATSLGASRVSARSLEWSRERHFAHAVVPDAAAVRAAARFADDARMLVEVACGATLAAAYADGGALLRRALGFERGEGGEAGEKENEWRRKNVVLVVCGGSNISLEMLRGYMEKFGAAGDEGVDGAGVDK